MVHQADTRRPPLPWFDALKGAALVWIFLNHLAERRYGGPAFMNPNAHWPPLAERFAELKPRTGHGWIDLPANVLRYVGWCGDQGVGLFLVLSGFGLMYGGFARPFAAGGFYRRRLLRLYPTWWMAHGLLLLCWLLAGLAGAPDRGFLLSLLGLRVTPDTMYTPVGAWWFVSLLLQLYLMFPPLRALLLRLGTRRFLLLVLGVTLPLRAAGLFYFDGYLDAWSRGAIGLSRLPEFAFGMALGLVFARAPETAARALAAKRSLLLAAGAWLLGMLASFFLLGMAPALLLLAIGAFVLLSALLRRSRLQAPLGWIGVHSYSLYLVHHPLLDGLVPRLGMLQGGALALLLCAPVALLLERLTALVMRRPRRAALLVATWLAIVVGLDQLVRAVDPREVSVFGWGERPSLQPSEPFSWTLKPATTTRLRWESYDYTVTANALGFPGPLYDGPPAAGTLRILTVGDAFTSAEGVDTDEAWPRLLERNLRADHRAAEVANFAITGYGPRQYRQVLEAFVPRLLPQRVLVTWFVNDFADLVIGDAQFQNQIGFGGPDPDSLAARWLPRQLRRWLEVEVAEPLAEFVTGRRPYGELLGFHPAFRREGLVARPAVQQQAEAELRRMAAVCKQHGAELWLLMVPAREQVLDRAQLAYAPRTLTLADPRYDAELPQRVTEQLAARAGIRCIDLRPMLKAAGDGTYQRRNMHWTAKGHAALANWLLAAVGR